ncbi:MAG TPA: STAS domain-containing protein, partial [Thermodesulfovibrionales bacterium]|nr:STAS domain-containing protein [Thermodesulfovibrionales bacterium]
NVSYSSIILVEEGKEYGTVASEYSLTNNLKPSLGEILYFKDFPTLNEAYQKRQYVLVADTLKHELSPKEMEMAERLNIGSILVVPLVLGEKTLGTMQLSSFGEVKDFTEEEIGICQTIANQVAIAIENAHLYEKEQRAMELLKEQQKAFMEISVPVVKIWNRILLVPLIGVFDSARAQLTMETLLTEIEDTQAKVVILDVSGIPVVDSLVAKHLIRTVSAAKLMGAECIVTGIRSRISQTLVQLGVDLSGITTRTSLAEGLKVALDLTEHEMTSK